MIDSGGLRHHTSLPFNPKSIMSSPSITLLATRHLPATAGVMSCAALAHCAGLPRPVQVIAINSPVSFGGADVFKPTRVYSWDLGTSYIREERQMA